MVIKTFKEWLVENRKMTCDDVIKKFENDVLAHLSPKDKKNNTFIQNEFYVFKDYLFNHGFIDKQCFEQLEYK